MHVYSDRFKRGYFKFYNYAKKKEMYVLGKKYYSYKRPEPNFLGRFPGFYCVDRDAYLTKKQNSLRSYVQDGKLVNELDIRRQAYAEVCHYMYYGQKHKTLNKKDIGQLLGIQARTVTKYLKLAGEERRRD